MSNRSLIPQTTLSFLFLSVFCALMLHVSRLPVWLFLFSFLALSWRVAMFTGRLPKPNWLIKLSLVSGGFLGIYLTYGAQLSIEGMVSLLIAGVMLKPLEVERQKDSYLLLFLNYFLCALIFLFDRSPLVYFLSFLVMLLTLSAQVLLHFYMEPMRGYSIRVALGLFFKSLPLALVLFVVLPRIGPLWTLNVPTKSGVVGLSDTMSPGSIASLGENNELAFRVKVLSGTLPMPERYWRAFTLSRYDGSHWQRDSIYKTNFQGGLELDSEKAIRYQVLLEPHEKNWLFSVGYPKTVSSDVEVAEDGSLYRQRKIYNQWQYQVESQLTEVLPQTTLSASERKLFTSLPRNVSIKSREWAIDIYKNQPTLDGFLAAVRAYIGDGAFEYTLSPGEYSGADQIDDFLFESKSGFCAYYAGALTFLLRSIDVPARVVLGYMGGEENPISNTINVYQYEAHAWVEVYMEGEGWLRVDPTAWVSPDRVESGLQQAIPNEFKGFDSQWSWLRGIRSQLQAFDYFWNDWMVSYKGDRQQNLLSTIWGERTAIELAWIVAGVLGGVISALFAFLWWDQRSQPRSYQQKVYDDLCEWLRQQDKTMVKTGMTFQQLIGVLKLKNPNVARNLDELSMDIHKCFYAASGVSNTEFKQSQLLKRIKQIKKQVC